MKIAYFINQYPKVSHSFIRREINALERLGYKVERYALRTNQAELADPLDQEELKKTQYILAERPSKIILSVLQVLLTTPVLFLKALTLAVKLGIRSDRGLIIHLIYVIEACILLQWEKSAGIAHIHAHFGTNSTTIVMLAYLLGGTHYSFTVHGPEEFDKPEFIHLAEKIQHCRFVVAISSYGRSQLLRWIPAGQWPKVKIVHCGLDPTFFKAGAIPPKATTQLVCIGRLCEQKGQLLLLEAIHQLAEEGVACQLVLAGDGPMRPEIEDKIKQYQLTNQVSITGWVSSQQVQQLLINSKAMVLPSFAEGLPVVIMEALALGRPVITTYVAGIPELVHHKKNGWLVPAGDIDSLKAAIKDLFDINLKDVEVMGQHGFDSVVTQHNIDTEARKLDNLFKIMAA